MKPLVKFNNVEKAQLLHSLFPQEMPGLLKFIAASAQTIVEEQEQQRKNWKDPIFSFDLWLSLAIQVQQAITKYGRQMEKSKRLFSDQLFDGYNAMFTINSIVGYTTIRRHPNAKFSQAVDLIFNP